MRAVDLLAAAVVASSSIPPWDADLQLHSDLTADKFDARCIDGSNGGFYYRKASSPSAATKWKFHFMGGGWCNDGPACAKRAGTLLGSSSFWTPKLSDLWGGSAGFYGLMSANTNQTGDDVGNPFGDWNFVWFAYCDGSSQTSDRTEPLMVDGNPIYFRGRALLDAHLFELERNYQFLTSATEVIVSGTSAGGMSTYMHSSFIKSRLKVPNVKLVAVPDAGFWWDTLAYGSTTERPWLDSMSKSITAGFWNSTLRGNNAKCLIAPPDGNVAKCYSQPYAYAYLDVPTFVIQSLDDPANFGYCFHPPCGIKGNTPGNCDSAQLESLAAYHNELQGNITAAQQNFGDRDGHFLTSCNQHEESCRQFDWWGITIGSKTMNNTFFNWYKTQGTDAAGSRAIDVAWPGDGSCHVASHGSC